MDVKMNTTEICEIVVYTGAKTVAFDRNFDIQEC